VRWVILDGLDSFSITHLVSPLHLEVSLPILRTAGAGRGGGFTIASAMVAIALPRLPAEGEDIEVPKAVWESYEDEPGRSRRLVLMDRNGEPWGGVGLGHQAGMGGGGMGGSGMVVDGTATDGMTTDEMATEKMAVVMEVGPADPKGDDPSVSRPLTSIGRGTSKANDLSVSSTRPRSPSCSPSPPIYRLPMTTTENRDFSRPPYRSTG